MKRIKISKGSLSYTPEMGTCYSESGTGCYIFTPHQGGSHVTEKNRIIPG